ncbi:12-oxophytodienoate-10 [Hyphodiscus hymeniophilus]|uniref:12-oxophytodienoate-10 n=1 Tax=Hyphodiscus hymeniophilus TaxID=353542 RepID=A0A9P6VF79_9HELO|nr:12-oxophytodienoate-10 [Hyphodiscus hymeniophilus]
MTLEDILQSPFDLSLNRLSHRIVLAPMTRMRASEYGIPNATAAQYYAQRATPNGLMISEGVVVHPRGKGFPNTPGIWTHEQIEAWKPITSAVKARGGVFFAQLWHVGRVTVPSQTGGLPGLASTDTPLPGNHLLFGEEDGEEPYVRGEAMSREDIASVVSEFAQAAKNAIKAGFDGIEIHGGNGYLLDTFVHNNINDRTDEYGGSLENRLRFPLEVVDAVVSEIGHQRTAIRIAPFHVLQQTLDSNRIETFSKYTEELEKRHLAYVHMVEPRYDQLSTEGAFSGKIKRVPGAGGDCAALPLKEAKDVSVGEFSLWTFRRILKETPLIGAGGYCGDTARDAIAEGRIDLVAFGRYFTSNADLADRILEQKPLKKYDRKTFYTPGVEGYLE